MSKRTDDALRALDEGLEADVSAKELLRRCQRELDEIEEELRNG